MPNNVGFRITGAYFGSKKSVTKEIRVNVPTPNPTIYEVMVEVAKLVASGGVPGVSRFAFGPTFPSPSDSLNSVTIEYSVPPKSPYNAGTYFLQESKMANPVYVFQYYIFDKNFKQKNNDNQSVLFNQRPNPGTDPVIEDDDTVVWRQVAILQGANAGTRVQADLVNAIEGFRQANLF